MTLRIISLKEWANNFVEDNLNMLNLLKSDFYKLFRMKSFYVCCIVAAAIATITILLQSSVNNMMEEVGAVMESQIVTLENVLYNILSPSGDWFILIIIAVSLFITIEYNAGTLKNIAARGFKRENIFLSKMIVCVVEAIILALIFAVVSIIAAIILLGIPSNGFSDNFWGEIFTVYGVDILILIGYTSFVAMIAYLIRTNGGTIAITLCVHYLVPTIIMMFNAAALMSTETGESSVEVMMSYSTNPYGDIAYYWIGTLSGTVIESCRNGTIYIPILAALAYIVVTSTLGMLIFKKRDIK